MKPMMIFVTVVALLAVGVLIRALEQAEPLRVALT